MFKVQAVLVAITLAGVAFGASVQTWAAGKSNEQRIQGDHQKQKAERWKILNDKTVAPKGSTGPTAPPKPSRGGSHK
jgi:hypothetical protein